MISYNNYKYINIIQPGRISTISTAYLQDTITIRINGWEWGADGSYIPPNSSYVKYAIMNIIGRTQDGTNRVFYAHNTLITQHNKPSTWYSPRTIVPVCIVNQNSLNESKSTYTETNLRIAVSFNNASQKINYAMFNSDNPITFQINAEFVYFT